MSDITLHWGNCLEVMPTLQENSFDSIVTDPPYGLSFMGKDWDGGIPGEAFWQAALRVAKPGAHLLAFGGTRTFHRLTCAIEDAGWEIRDCLMWLQGQGFPKGKNQLKPAWEPIIMARKPLTGTVAQNVLEWGTGGINVDASRIGTDGRPNIVANGKGIGGSFEMGSGWAEGTTTQGRWPSNLLLDEESARLLDEQSGERRTGNIGAGIYRDTQSDSVARGHFNGWDNKGHTGDTGGASRFFYVAKASKRDRSTDGAANNTHPTCKPSQLMKYLCRLVTPPNGVILDPFLGSGTTGVAAKLEGFSFVGIEVDSEYLEIARRRIEAAEDESRAQLPLLEVA